MQKYLIKQIFNVREMAIQCRLVRLCQELSPRRSWQKRIEKKTTKAAHAENERGSERARETWPYDWQRRFWHLPLYWFIDFFVRVL